MSGRRAVLMTVTLLVLIVLGLSLFTVKESERGIVLRLGKLKTDTTGQPLVMTPGLHLKMPFIDSTRIFDVRLQTLDIQTTPIVTVEKKHVIVDLFVKWRIDDLSKFFTSTRGDRKRVDRLLREKIIDGVRGEFGRRTIHEVVSGERQEVMETLRQEAARNVGSLGIQVLDVRVKRIDLPTEVSSNVFDRMRSERQRVAAEHRAEGRSKGEIIRAQADARVTIILAKAEQEAKAIRGLGDAEAARVYGAAYSKNPEFYRFYRSLEAYKATFKDKHDILVLQPGSEFFDYLTNSGAQKAQ